MSEYCVKTDYAEAEEVLINNQDANNFRIVLSYDEKIRCLEEILNKLKKILYVYDKTKEEESGYNYKIFCGGILIYVSSSNLLFNGELVNIIVNLNAIVTNNFEKKQVKRIVFESINQAEHLLNTYKNKKIKKTEESPCGVEGE